MEEEYIILNTASFAREFDFYSPQTPDYRTLKERYGANLDSQKLIIEVADGKFSMFLSQIPCSRSDAEDRKMFYNIVAKGKTGKNEIATAIQKIATAAIEDIQSLGVEFDKIFTSDYLRQFDDESIRKSAKTQEECVHRFRFQQL